MPQVVRRRALPIEHLERRVLLSDVTLAVIGDYSAGQGAHDVSQLVKGWNPSFVVTTGDNNYPAGSAATIDANVGQYYHSFIAPYRGTYGAGAADGVNHFFPALGEHDWLTAGAQPYLNYFTLPNNERYYTVQQENVGIFILDSSAQEPDGNSATSIQAQWLHNALAASTAKWKLVFCFNPPFSSGANGDTPIMQWPFKDWGATAVISGHDQDYERITTGGLTYFVDGLGGQGKLAFNAPVSGSQLRFADDFGAMRIDASDTALHCQFVSASGKVVDDYTIGTGAPPAAPVGLTAQPLGPDQVGLTWRDDANDEIGFTLERSSDGVNFSQIAQVPIGVTTYADHGLAAGATYVYRVRATGLGGSSAPSQSATTTTLATPNGVTYLSDLTWVSASNQFGPVRLDRSNGGQFNPDGRTITLDGTSYIKGLGAHANSTITYTLAGQYARFLADVGVDGEETAHGAADFQVFADGRMLYDSGVLTFQSSAQHIALDVSGVNALSLVVNSGGDSIDYDHADWADARLAAASAIPAAPPGLSVVGVTDSSVILSWAAGADSAGIKIERSDDGIQFATVGQALPGATSYSDTSVAPFHTYIYRIRASTSAGDSDPSANVSATTAPAGFGFVHGIVGLGGIALAAGAYTDSYDAMAGAYLLGAAGQNGSIASRGFVRLARGAVVHGNAIGATVTSGTVTGQRGSPRFPLSYPMLSAPSANDNAKVLTYIQRGSFRLASRRSAILPAGSYVLSNMTLAAGAILHVSGPTVLYIAGSLTLSSGAQIIANRPADLRIVLLGAGKVALGTGAALTADLYAPGAKVSLGARSTLLGSVISASLAVGARGAVHYDQSLGQPLSDLIPFPLVPTKTPRRTR